MIPQPTADTIKVKSATFNILLFITLLLGVICIALLAFLSGYFIKKQIRKIRNKRRIRRILDDLPGWDNNDMEDSKIVTNLSETAGRPRAETQLTSLSSAEELDKSRGVPPPSTGFQLPPSIEVAMVHAEGTAPDDAERDMFAEGIVVNDIDAGIEDADALRALTGMAVGAIGASVEKETFDPRTGMAMEAVAGMGVAGNMSNEREGITEEIPMDVFAAAPLEPLHGSCMDAEDSAHTAAATTAASSYTPESMDDIVG